METENIIQGAGVQTKMFFRILDRCGSSWDVNINQIVTLRNHGGSDLLYTLNMTNGQKIEFSREFNQKFFTWYQNYLQVF